MIVETTIIQITTGIITPTVQIIETPHGREINTKILTTTTQTTIQITKIQQAQKKS